LSRIPGELTAEVVSGAAAALDLALRLVRRRSPRIALCALNPHAGESGILGGEEEKILLPAALRARRAGVDLTLPIPADAAWRRHVSRGCDGLVCLYHDQALIGLKAVAGLELVNWTVGLPFIRVSPGHGTAYDIAGQGKADPAGTIAAARLAVRVSAAR
jgi:4-hydroxythreonine-4-phosphate dehydrogenase